MGPRSEEKVLLEIQQNLAAAKQAAEQLGAKYFARLSSHLKLADVQRAFVEIFNEIARGQLPNDFCQRLLALVEESPYKKGNSSPIVLPPLNIRASDSATNIPDEVLLREIIRCVDNIRTRVNELFTKHQENLLRLVRFREHNQHDAEEDVQDTHIRAYLKIWTLFYTKDGTPKTIEHHFLSWLYTIALRVIADRKGGPVADYPEDEEGAEFEPSDPKTDVSQQAILEILRPALLYIVCLQNEPHKVFVYVFKEWIKWEPAEIVELLSGCTLEELFDQFRKHCMHRFDWSPEAVDWVLGPLHDKLSKQDKDGKARGKKRLGDYWSADPGNDIQNWYRSVVHRIEQNRSDILALASSLKGL